MANVATGCKSKKWGVDNSNAFRSYHPDWMVKLHQTPSQKDDPCRFPTQNISHKREWEHQEDEARERQERAIRVVKAAMRETPPDITSWSGPKYARKNESEKLTQMRRDAVRKATHNDRYRDYARKGEDMELMQMRRNAARKAPSYNQYRQ